MRRLQDFLTPVLVAATFATTAVGCGAVGSMAGLRNADGFGVSAKPDQIFRGGARSAQVEIAYKNRTQLKKMAELGIDFQGFDLDKKRLRTELESSKYDAVNALGVRIIPEPKRQGFGEYDKQYKTVEGSLAALQGLAQKRPDLAEVVDIGDSWEKTQGKGRDIVALHIGKKGAGKPVVLYAGCHHARELVTPEMIHNFAQHLIEGYGKDAEITGLVDTRDIWLVPMVNPDGHKHAEAGEDQRKNTNIVTGGKRRIGVDLNRNYGAPSWSQVGSSSNPESDTFHGKSAFSEPEVQAMRDLMRKIKPTYLLTFHSFSNVVLWPWGYTEAPPPDPRLALVGKQLGKLSGYKAGQSSTELYATAGDDTDFAFAELGTLAYTVEVGTWSDGFDPPFSTVAKFWKENLPMMMFVLRTADNPAAAAGPELKGGASRAAATESFVGTPGKTGTGRARQGLATGGQRQLVWTHGRDAAGNWGPWDITWSK